MTGRRARVAWIVAIALNVIAGWSACRSSQLGSEEVGSGVIAGEELEPATAFAEAERFRRVYDSRASWRAISKYRAARAAWIRDGDPARAARASHRLGATHEQLGALRDALSAYLEALSLSRDTGDLLLESEMRSAVGSTLAALGDSEEALRSASMQCRNALSLARGSGGSREQALALNCSGEVEYHRGNLEEALEFYDRAEAMWRGVGDPRGRAETLFFEGTTRSDLSQFVESEASYREALTLWSSVGDMRGEAMTLVALGRLEHRRGHYQEALNHFRQALDRLEPIGDIIWEASGIAAIGSVYFDMAEAAQAASYWEAALALYKKAGLHMATLDLLLAVGRAHLVQGDPSVALQRFHEALALAEEIGSARWQSYSLRYMGLANQFLGHPKESLALLERSLALQRSGGDPRLEAAIVGEMGNAHELLGHHNRALEDFARSLQLSRASADRIGEAQALYGLARVSCLKHDLSSARHYIENSLRVAESLRTEVASRDLRTSYFGSVYRYYELYMEVLMRLHEMRPREGLAAAAFEASERSRARSLLESLTEAGVDIRSGVDPDLLALERSLKLQLDASTELGLRSNAADGTPGVETSAKEILDLEARYDLVLAEIRSRSPRYAALTAPRPLRLGEVQRQLLDDETLLLEYALGEERSFLWAVTSDDYAVYELASRTEIEGEVERVHELVTARARAGGESLQERSRRVKEADALYWEASAHLAEILLGPVAQKMAGKRILVVTDGALHYLPFGALPIPGSGEAPTPMIVEHEIVNLPSASALAVLRQETRGREKPQGTVAVFADPVFTRNDPRLGAIFAEEKTVREFSRSSEPPETDTHPVRAMLDVGFFRESGLGIPRLVSTRREAEAIVAAAPAGTSYCAVGFDANRSAAMSPALARFRIVHFATHGVFDDENPSLSGIVFSMFDEEGRAQDGFMRLHDIYNLRLPVNLVVLSACNTALGKNIQGEGLVGIVRAFMYAGAGRVVATLWKVDDEATGELMSGFYQEMFANSRSPAAALRSAQLSMWREAKWRPPFYWAAFVLQGEWLES